jgi:hypothetical protein
MCSTFYQAHTSSKWLYFTSRRPGGFMSPVPDDDYDDAMLSANTDSGSSLQRSSSDSHGAFTSSTSRGSSGTRSRKPSQKSTNKACMSTLTGRAHGVNARRATSDSSIGISPKIRLLPLPLLSHSFIRSSSIHIHIRWSQDARYHTEVTTSQLCPSQDNFCLLIEFHCACRRPPPSYYLPSTLFLYVLRSII